MPWVRLDDRFPSHRKISLLSDRAFRLHVSALCWCAENLTDGKIRDEELRLVAHVRGMTATAKELVTREVWERLPDGWQIHDYLDYNKSADQIRSERADNAARQQEFRDKRKANATARQGKPKTPNKIERNGVTNGVTNGGSNGTPVPGPTPEVTPNGVTTASKAEQTGGVSDQLQPLAAALSANGLGAVAWDIRKHTDWERIRRQVDRLGVDIMARSAVLAAERRGEPDSVTAWIGRWESLPDPQPIAAPQLPEVAGTNVVALPTGQHRPATSDIRSTQAVEAGRRIQALADAKRQENR